MYFLYRHIRLDTNKPFYIGIGTVNEKAKCWEREFQRAYDTKGRNRYWRNIVAKTDYEIEILYTSDSKDEIEQKEIEFINLYGRRDLGTGSLCNLTDGGMSGLNKSRLSIVKQLKTAKLNGTYEDMCERMRKAARENRRDGIYSPVRRDVYMYDFDGKFVDKFVTVSSAAEYLKQIGCNCTKKMDTYKPISDHYLFSKYQGESIDSSLLIRFDYKAIGRNAVRKISVRLEDKATGEVFDFEALRDASAFLGKGRWYVSARIQRGALDLKQYKIILN